MDPANNSAAAFASGINQPVDLKVAVDGSLYYLSIGSGVFRVQFPANQAPPTITMQPADQTVTEGQPATFNVSANGTALLSYQWQRNSVDVAGATASGYTISTTTLADNGARFRCVVTNGFGSVTSNEAMLTVTSLIPSLITEPNTDRAIAFDSVTMVRDPFSIINLLNFSSDQRTRVMLFATNADLMPGEPSSAVTAQAEDALHLIYPLPLEFVGKVPGLNSFTEIVVKLPDNLPTNADVLVSITLHGKTSNKARLTIR
ncbi:MAG: immunoglobulin domain-containing protein [bacterium]